jgi:hypothetical protein
LLWDHLHLVHEQQGVGMQPGLAIRADGRQITIQAFTEDVRDVLRQYLPGLNAELFTSYSLRRVLPTAAGVMGMDEAAKSAVGNWVDTQRLSKMALRYNDQREAQAIKAKHEVVRAVETALQDNEEDWACTWLEFRRRMSPSVLVKLRADLPEELRLESEQVDAAMPVPEAAERSKQFSTRCLQMARGRFRAAIGKTISLNKKKKSRQLDVQRQCQAAEPRVFLPSKSSLAEFRAAAGEESQVPGGERQEMTAASGSAEPIQYKLIGGVTPAEVRWQMSCHPQAKLHLVNQAFVPWCKQRHGKKGKAMKNPIADGIGLQQAADMNVRLCSDCVSLLPRDLQNQMGG